MIETISSRVASGQPAFKANEAVVARLLDAHSPTRPVEEQAAEGPAATKTLSSGENGSVQQDFDTLLAERGYAGRGEGYGEKRAKLAHDFFAAAESRAAVNMELNPILHGKANLVENQQKYAKLLQTDPVPATELTGDAKSAAFKLINKLGSHHG